MLWSCQIEVTENVYYRSDHNLIFKSFGTKLGDHNI